MKSERVRGGANQNLERIYWHRSGQRELALGMAQLEEIFHPGPLSPSRVVEVASPAEGVRDRRPGGDGEHRRRLGILLDPRERMQGSGG